MIIQFLRENNLNQSLSTLEKESNQYLNTVENKSKFLQDILDGRWDIILKQVNHLGLPKEYLFDLYEQVRIFSFCSVVKYLVTCCGRNHVGHFRINRSK